METVVMNNKFVINEDKRKTAFRQALGSLLWLTQSRFDLSFQISKIATDFTNAVADPSKASILIKFINKTIDEAKRNPITIWFFPLCNPDQANKLPHSGRLSIFAFCDAGFATLHGSSSIQATIIVLGVPKDRDGETSCLGHHIDCFSRKINRVSRSTLAAESVALADAVDISLWHKTLFTEIFFGVFSDILFKLKQPCMRTENSF